MKKIALFVEGQTELIFVRKLIDALAGNRKAIEFKAERWIGKKFLVVELNAVQGASLHVLIVDCSSDAAVKSAILDRRANLESQGFSRIVGLRDLYPLKHDELGKLKAGLAYNLPTKGIPTDIIVAVCEVEAWFAQEECHYLLVDPQLTCSYLKQNFGFDPGSECAEILEHPSGFLNKVYSSVGQTYNKKRSTVSSVIDSIDYDNLYLVCRHKLEPLRIFIDMLDDFLQ